MHPPEFLRQLVNRLDAMANFIDETRTAFAAELDRLRDQVAFLREQCEQRPEARPEFFVR